MQCWRIMVLPPTLGFCTGGQYVQKLCVSVQVPNVNLVSKCLPHGDAYHTRHTTWKAGASVQRAVVVRQSQMRSHPLSLVSEIAGGDWPLVTSGVRSS
jgi:hypothetical protein